MRNSCVGAEVGLTAVRKCTRLVRMNAVRITIPFPPDVHAAIAERAKIEGRSFNKQVVWMLTSAFADKLPSTKESKR